MDSSSHPTSPTFRWPLALVPCVMLAVWGGELRAQDPEPAEGAGGLTMPNAMVPQGAGGATAAAEEENLILEDLTGEVEIRRAVIPGPGEGGDGLATPALTDPTATAPGEVPGGPVMGSAPFEPELPEGDGPVVLGTDLQPGSEPSMLLPEYGEGLVTEDLVEKTDPWVFSLGVAVIYDDNIRLSSNGAQEDYVGVTTGSVAWQWGDTSGRAASWARIFYEATGIVFVEDDSGNSVDHDWQAGGEVRTGKSALGAEARWRRLSGATPDVGDRVDRDEVDLRLTASHEWSGRTFVEAEVGGASVDYEDESLTDYEQWVAEAYLGYELSGRTRVAVGGGTGQLDVGDAGTQDFQRGMIKVTRQTAGALALSAKGGVEFRQGGRTDSATPVFSLRADWEPVKDSTKVGLEAFRETVASASLAGENYRRTGLALRILQQLGGRFSAGMESGFEHLSYAAISTAEGSGRSDDYWFVRPSLKYTFDKRRRAEVFYQHRQDDSSEEAFSFTANQWGVSIGLDF